MKCEEDEFPSLKTFSVARAYFYVILNPKSLWALLCYLRTVLCDFFLLQFSVKLGFRKIPITHVDHHLDDSVPFDPTKVHVYLDFVNFWIRPMSFMLKRFGVKKAIPYCARYLNAIDRCYSEAARMYRFRMSTTNRPPADGRKGFRMIHLLDPHYLCVPSLHVAIVNLAYNFFRDTFTKLGMEKEELTFYTSELYAGAIEITETVLYVKQHSVNCIPAALYMCLFILQDQFSIPDSVRFIESLFLDSTDIRAEDVEAIQDHILFLFEQLLLEGSIEDDWTEPVKRWILNYASPCSEKYA
mgnify:FL=1